MGFGGPGPARALAHEYGELHTVKNGQHYFLITLLSWSFSTEQKSISAYHEIMTHLPFNFLVEVKP
jgi:hypothetical protein